MNNIVTSKTKKKLIDEYRNIHRNIELCRAAKTGQAEDYQVALKHGFFKALKIVAPELIGSIKFEVEL